MHLNYVLRGMKKIISIFHSKRQDSIEELISPYLTALYNQAYRYTGTKDAADDLIQDLLVYLLTHRDKVLGLDPVKPWLMRCLYHRFVDTYRKNRQELTNLDSIMQEPSSNDDNLETGYFHEQVLNLLDTLSANQRVAVSLFDIEGYTLDEIAHVMEMPVSTVKSHLHRARKKLKTLLAPQLSDIDERYKSKRG